MSVLCFQVGDKTDWDLGVARQSINRKGSIMVRPDSGYWAICRRKGGNLSACAGPSATIRLQETPKKVGIFLDCEKGSVSFYDAQAKTHIYTYSSCTFTEPLYPYFNPCVQENGKNLAPLVICPVLREEQDKIIEWAAWCITRTTNIIILIQEYIWTRYGSNIYCTVIVCLYICLWQTKTVFSFLFIIIITILSNLDLMFRKCLMKLWNQK